jgi:EAL domain-containing protein (putative c-di-GMP-specific phosphodiesterase class I)
VTNAPVDEKDRHIIKAATDLAHAFGMRVVGEGVDCLEVMQALDELGCEYAQGFFIARPMRAELLLEWARAYGSTSTVRDLIELKPAQAAEG